MRRLIDRNKKTRTIDAEWREVHNYDRVWNKPKNYYSIKAFMDTYHQPEELSMGRKLFGIAVLSATFLFLGYGCSLLVRPADRQLQADEYVAKQIAAEQSCEIIKLNNQLKNKNMPWDLVACAQKAR